MGEAAPGDSARRRTAAQALANINSAVDGTWRTYANAARYMLENKKDYDAGLKYVDQSLALKEDWYNVWIKAELRRRRGTTRTRVPPATTPTSWGRRATTSSSRARSRRRSTSGRRRSLGPGNAVQYPAVDGDVAVDRRLDAVAGLGPVRGRRARSAGEGRRRRAAERGRGHRLDVAERTEKPTSPSGITSGSPPTAEAITGTPQAIASSAARPKLSVSLGRGNDRRRAGQPAGRRARRGTRRRRRGRARATWAAMRGRSGPSPTRQESGRAGGAQAREDVDDVVNPFDRAEVRDVDDRRAAPATRAAPAPGRPRSARRRRSSGRCRSRTVSGTPSVSWVPRASQADGVVTASLAHDREPGERQEARIAADQRDVGAVKRGHQPGAAARPARRRPAPRAPGGRSPRGDGVVGVNDDRAVRGARPRRSSRSSASVYGECLSCG